jgi:16S rRNA (guanine527-N7)-methyltransferase
MENLAQDAQALFNIHLTERQGMALVTYEKELIEWNQKFNLTAIRDSESIRTKHFLDSIFLRPGMEGFTAEPVDRCGHGRGVSGHSA